MTEFGTERQRVRAVIERAGVAILMNVNEKGTHIGRPMLPLLVLNDPHIYFLTHQSSRKVTQLAVDHKSDCRSSAPIASSWWWVPSSSRAIVC
jgi:general stress protein 26